MAPRRWRPALVAVVLGAVLVALAGAPAGRPDASRPGAGRPPAASGPSPRASDGPAPAPLPVARAAVVANPRTAWGPSDVSVAQARAAVAQMSVEQLAGQVIVGRFAGVDSSNARKLVAAWHLAGVVVMGDNIVSLDQVRAVTAGVHAAVAADGRPWPAVVGVDEEGGRVSRMAGLLADLPAFATFGSADAAATRARFVALGRDLRGQGFTMDFAPVADVTIGAADPTIGDRSASSDPSVASRAVVAALGGLLEGGVVPVVKHFPGHGSVTTDSHVGLPVQPASLRALDARDLLPFRAAVQAGVPAVMVGHLDVTALEPGVPSSQSSATYRLLRTTLGFDGVAITDALDMGAVAGGAPGEETVRAIAAGADLALMPPDVGAAHAALVAAVQTGRLPRARLEEAATRVVALQLWLASWAAGT